MACVFTCTSFITMLLHVTSRVSGSLLVFYKPDNTYNQFVLRGQMELTNSERRSDKEFGRKQTTELVRCTVTCLLIGSFHVLYFLLMSFFVHYTYLSANSGNSLMFVFFSATADTFAWALSQLSRTGVQTLLFLLLIFQFSYYWSSDINFYIKMFHENTIQSLCRMYLAPSVKCELHVMQNRAARFTYKELANACTAE